MDSRYQYVVARLQEALACDERVGLQDVKVLVSHGCIHLIGEVQTAQRRNAIDAVAARVIPGVPVRNEVRVLTLGSDPEPESIE
jgi:osmotically-inducible protein OsmY